MENTLHGNNHEGRSRDHLHIRGEYEIVSSICVCHAGSPPHTWRILFLCYFSLHLYRITSTYVENTTSTSTWKKHVWDHLHIRGEYTLRAGSHLALVGSPPHTWRIHQIPKGNETRVGITSTYVENTCFAKGRRSSSKDHLHIRGEYYMKRHPSYVAKGSPPHTWRIQYGCQHQAKDSRITSTYVENTHNQFWRLACCQDHLHIRGEYNKSSKRLFKK